MITKKQQDKIKDILLQNKLSGQKPSTVIELATQLGTHRQNIYLAFQNKHAKTEALLRNWLQSENRRFKYKETLIFNDDNRTSLKNFGFEKQDNIFATKPKNVGGVKYNWVIDEKKNFKLKVVINDTNEEIFIDNLGFIKDMLKSYVIKKK